MLEGVVCNAFLAHYNALDSDYIGVVWSKLILDSTQQSENLIYALLSQRVCNMLQYICANDENTSAKMLNYQYWYFNN